MAEASAPHRTHRIKGGNVGIADRFQIEKKAAGKTDGL